MEGTLITEIRIYVAPSQEQDIHRLYCRRNPVHAAVLTVFALVFLALAAGVIPMKVVPPPFERTMLVGLAGLPILLAFGILPLWWRTHYWPAVQRNFPEAQDCRVQITTSGIFSAEQQQLFRTYHSFKMDDRTVLLFLNKSYAVPLHRSLFSSEPDWQAFRTAVLNNDRHLVQQLNAP